MAIIYAPTKSKQKKNVTGWKLKKAQHDEWLAKVSSMTTNFSAKNRSKVDPKPEQPATVPSTTVSTFLPKSFEAFKGGTVKVRRPELEYADDPEMLERELKARERKFNVAPAYNKGGDQFVTEEHLQTQLSGNKRRS